MPFKSKMPATKRTTYPQAKANASCSANIFAAYLKPTSLQAAENADMHAGQASTNAAAASPAAMPSPVPPGISIEMVAAMFSLAAKPEIMAYASRQSAMPMGTNSGSAARLSAASMLSSTAQGRSVKV